MHDDVDEMALLRRFARDGEEEAFAELVRRHLNLVHSAALRQIRSPQLAEDIAQSVFSDLARDATRLKPGTILAAWLYEVTRRTAIDVARREARRQLREQVAVEMNAMNSTSSDWAQVEPLLDDAMAALDDTDRTAVLLRYFENRSLRDVGAALGTSDDTAQKRVSRAVDRLRDFFAQRGVTVGASGLVVVISTNAVQAAPVGLAAVISTASVLTGATLTTTATVTTTKAIAMTTLQKSLVVTVLAATVGTGIYEAQQASELRAQVHALRQQQAPLTDQIQQVQRQRDKATSQFALAQLEIEQLKRDAADIHRLRGEIGVLRQQAAGITAQQPGSLESEIKRWLKLVEIIKAKFQEMPEKKIPELQYVSDDQWLDAARLMAKLRGARELSSFSEKAWRSLLAEMRQQAKVNFSTKLGEALQRFIGANAGSLPADLAVLNNYYVADDGQPTTIESAVLNRYRLVQSGNLRDIDFETPLIVESAPAADSEYDSRFSITALASRYEGVGAPNTTWASRRGNLRLQESSKVMPFRKEKP